MPLTQTVPMPRHALLHKLRQSPKYLLILLTAPAGYGKTSLLQFWAAQTSQQSYWLRLSPADNDVATFWQHVLPSLQAAFPDISPGKLAANAEAEAYSAFGAVQQRKYCKKTSALIIDNYSSISNPSVQLALYRLLLQLPSHWNVLVTARSPQAAPFLGRLRLQGKYLHITLEDLRLDREECTYFFNTLHALALSSSDIASLQQRTEGCLALAQAAALHIQEGGTVASFDENCSYVTAFFQESIMPTLASELLPFVQTTSVLQSLHSPLCEVVTGSCHSQQLLQQLETQGLVQKVALPAGQYSYRYPQLLAAWLQQRLASSEPQLWRQSHHKAAHWLSRYGDSEQAITHALQAKDYALALDVLKRVAMQLWRQGKEALLCSWFQQLPAAYWQQDLELRLLYLWVDNYRGYEQLQQAMQEIELLSQQAQAQSHEEACANLQTLRAKLAFEQGHLPEARAHIEKALRMIPENSLTLRCSAYFYLGIIHLDSGNISEAQEALMQARSISNYLGDMLSLPHINLALGSIFFNKGELKLSIISFQAIQEEFPSFATIKAHIDISRAYYERNALDKAKQHAYEAYLVGSARYQEADLFECHLVHAQALGALGAEQEAEQAFALAEKAAFLYANPECSKYVAEHKARYYLWRQQLEHAKYELQKCEVESYPVNAKELGKWLLLVRVWLLEGNVSEAAALLERMQTVHAEEQNTFFKHRLELHLSNALCFYAQGDADKSKRCLHAALALGQPKGYVRTFLDFSEPLREVLKNSPPPKPHKQFVQQLLHQSFAPGSHAHSHATLTSRELEVLSYLAKGYSNKQMAAELAVYPSTVKKHLSNIYNKLQVRRRLQAVEKARALDML